MMADDTIHMSDDIAEIERTLHEVMDFIKQNPEFVIRRYGKKYYRDQLLALNNKCHAACIGPILRLQDRLADLAGPVKAER